VSAWVDAAVAAGTFLSGLGGVAGIRALLKRRDRPRRVDAAVALSSGTLRWAERLEEQASRLLERVESAERKADDADRRADAAIRTASRIERQLEEVVSYMDTLLEAITTPDGRTADEQLDHIRRVAARRPAILRRSP
jgi:hypothetical protein